MGWLSRAKTDFANPDPVWLQPLGIGDCQEWTGKQSCGQKVTPFESAGLGSVIIHYLRRFLSQVLLRTYHMLEILTVFA
jgi:hypothetical protein